MGKKVKVGKSRKDKFYQLAKETGFRSRAAFKLIQLNRRFNFLASSKVLIDLCAAPGSWLQVAVREMPISSKIVGVDLVPIHTIPRVKTFQADITSDKCRLLLKNELNGVKANVVLNDGAPNVGAAWSIDEFNQAQLCLKAFALATEFLQKGGWFITKVFRSRDYEPLRWVLMQFFKQVKSVKPEASRLESAEIFLVGQGYLAPDKIDPKFLDPKSVFGEVEAPNDRNEILARLMKFTAKRKAHGYEDGDTLYNEIPVMEFIQTDDPLVCLAKTNKVLLDSFPEIAKHPTTTDAVKALLADIRVLGKGDIKNLLKWRKKIQDAIKAGQPEKDLAPEPVEAKPINSDEELETLVANALEDERKTLKKQLKKSREQRRKLAEKIVNKLHAPGDYIEQHDEDLFCLKELDQSLGKLYESGKLIGDTSVTGADDQARRDMAEQRRTADEKRDEETRLAVEGRRTVTFAKRGADKDQSHLDDLAKNEMHEDDEIFHSSSDEDQEEDEGEDDDFEVDLDDEDGSCPSVEEDDEEDGEENGDELSPELAEKRDRMINFINKKYRKPDTSKQSASLVMDLDEDIDEMTKKRDRVRKWCDNAEMKNLLGEDVAEQIDDEILSSDEEVAPRVKKTSLTTTTSSKSILEKTKTNGKRARSEKTVQINSDMEDEEENSMQKSEQDDMTEMVEQSAKKMKKLRRPLTPEERALAVKLVQSAKNRRELMEWNFHRFRFFEDEAQLPDWFVDEERKHMRKPLLPLTRQESEMTAAKPVQGRTISKAEEAKMRKKRRMAKKLKKVRQKVDDMGDDLPDKEKASKVKQMYQKAGLLKAKKRPVHFVVNNKSGNKSAPAPKGAKIKIVDRRMKADMRSKKSGPPPRGRHGKKGRVPVGKRKAAKK